MQTTKNYTDMGIINNDKGKKFRKLSYNRELLIRALEVNGP
jgi:hypothetical protein